MAVLKVMAVTILMRFTLSVFGCTLKRKKKASTRTPYKKAKAKVNGPKAGRQIAVKAPSTAPTYVAPIFFMKRADMASRTA